MMDHRFSTMTRRCAYITNRRYTNNHVIWGRPKGLLYGNIPGSSSEQKANLYPDKSATYFVANICMPPGSKLIIKGQYPHARYISFTVANQLGGGQLGNGRFLRGDEILPDDGSSNPFWPSSTRDVLVRNYTLNIVQGDIDNSNPEMPNTLYTGTTSENERVHLSIRTYLPDRGYDGTGNMLLDNCNERPLSGLPIVSLVLCNGTIVTGRNLVHILRCIKGPDPNGYELNQWIHCISESNDMTNAPCFTKLVSQVFWNTDYSVTGSFEADCPEKRVINHPPSNDGGFANNPDTKYMLLPFSFGYGDVVVVQGKMPTHPATRHGNSTLPNDTQVQYFSVSTAAGPASGEGYDTVCDEQVPLDSDGFYTIVVSWPWNRPVNCSFKNGYAWLNPGNGEGHYVNARNWVGIIYIRFQNCNANWKSSPANIPMPTVQNPIPQDPIIMGQYYPVGKYVNNQFVEQFKDSTALRHEINY